jgi:hypothetical protein
MTAKEKAIELVDKYYWTFGDGYLGEQHIQCALIAVDEIIAQIEPSVSMDVISARINYWEEVKQEIEKL